MRRPALWVAIKKYLIALPPLEILLRQECPTPGKTLSRHKETLIATQTWSSPKPYCDIEFLSRHKAEKSLSRPKPPSWLGNSVAEQGSLSRHRARRLCRARIPAARVCLLRGPKPGRAPSLRTMSRHEKPLRDPRSGFLVATETRKWAVAHSGPLHLQFPPFSFLSKQSKFNIN